MFGLVANVKSDNALRTNAKVRILSCHSGWDNAEVVGLTKYGRKITKHISWKRLKNIRPTFLPEVHRPNTRMWWETKEEAQKIADDLTRLWKGVRYFHRDGTLLENGITTGQVYARSKADRNYKYRPGAPSCLLVDRISHLYKVGIFDASKVK